MPEYIKPIAFKPNHSQQQSLEILAELDQRAIVEIPTDKGKYLTLGYLLQVGRLPNLSKKLHKIASTDINYLPMPKSHWKESSGESNKLVVSANQTYTENIKLLIGGEVILKYLIPPEVEPEIKLFLGNTEISLRTERFLSLNILSFVVPKKMPADGFRIEIRNLSDTDLVLAGVNQGLKLRFVDPLDVGNKSLSRKVKRGMTLIKNGEFKALLNAVYYQGKGKLNSLKRTLGTVLLATHLTSCVLPPDSSGPRVYSKDEMQYVTASQQGVSYSESGRFDQAEFNLRKALRATKNPPALLLSNLGFVLRAQSKFPDAMLYLNRALKTDPYFLHARVALGRTYFEMGDIDSAIREFLTAEKDYYGYWKGEPDQRLTSNFSNIDLLNVFTSLAIMYTQEGMLGESICYSQKGVDLHVKDYKPQAHARFLLSLEEFSLAGDTLKQVIFTGTQVSAPLPASLLTDPAAGAVGLTGTAPEEDPSSIQDIGVVRLLENNLPLAAEAFDRVLTLTIVPEDERLLTELLRYEVANAQNDSETIDLLNQSFSEDTVGLCESDSYVTPTYWPVRLRNRIIERRKLICDTYG